uniref:Transposable element P transposase-like RNase H C-terminal domain-containing protein n=1 Tax=Timema genevievae TaxID=629358 RepID=A0A7R9JQV9_TIMGE|nr:unnamed protein product [Timema genevievae]
MYTIGRTWYDAAKVNHGTKMAALQGIRLSVKRKKQKCRYALVERSRVEPGRDRVNWGRSGFESQIQYFVSDFKNFFGMIRQAAGSNDHPSTPTFLQFILKPPKYGNCYASEETSPYLSISDFKKIFQEGNNSSKIKELKSCLNGLVLQDDWDCDIVNEEHNYSGVPIVDCIVYYVKDQRNVFTIVAISIAWVFTSDLYTRLDGHKYTPCNVTNRDTKFVVSLIARDRFNVRSERAG